MAQLSDFIEPVSKLPEDSSDAIEVVGENVMSLLGTRDFPFASLIAYVQKKCACRILIEILDEEDHRKLGTPAVCYTQWWETIIDGEDDSCYIAHHLILIDPSYFAEPSLPGLRLAIAHELGHIVLHLSQLRDPQVIEQFRQSILLEDNTIPFDGPYEFDATLFAVLLCLFRHGEIIRKCSSIREMHDEWINCKSVLPATMVALVDTAFGTLLDHHHEIDYRRNATDRIKRALGAEFPLDPAIEARFDRLSQNLQEVRDNIDRRIDFLTSEFMDILNQLGPPECDGIVEDAVAEFATIVKKSLWFATGAEHFADQIDHGSGI